MKIVALSGTDDNNNVFGTGKDLVAKIIVIDYLYDLNKILDKMSDDHKWDNYLIKTIDSLYKTRSESHPIYKYRKKGTDFKDVKIVSFADPLREVVHTLTGIKNLKDSEVKKLHSGIGQLSVRQVLETLGEGMRNLLGENIWIDTSLNQVQDKKLVIIPDLRYQNEYEQLKKRGASFYNVQRLCLQQPYSDHISNTDLNEIKKQFPVINNEGSVLQLIRNVQSREQ